MITTETKTLLVYNPVSGKGQIKDSLSNIVETFTKHNCRVTVHPTAKKNDCFEYIKKNGRDYELISVCGGDGMLNEAVKALITFLAEERPPIAYLPAGSTNDFAASVGLSADLNKSVKTVVSGKPFRCDAGKFNSSYFAYIAAFGAFTSVAYDTSQEFKNIFGHLAYVMEGIRSLSSIKAHRITITCNGKKTEGNFIFGMVTNSLQVGGIKRGSKAAISLDDGMFEVLLVKEAKNAADFQTILTGIFTQNFDADVFVSLKTARIHFESSEAIPWTLDGEFGGNVKNADISILPRAFAVMV